MTAAREGYEQGSTPFLREKVKNGHQGTQDDKDTGHFAAV